MNLITHLTNRLILKIIMIMIMNTTMTMRRAMTVGMGERRHLDALFRTSFTLHPMILKMIIQKQKQKMRVEQICLENY